MAKHPHKELLKAAIADLRDIGFSVQPSFDTRYGKNVWLVGSKGNEVPTLIQTRSYDDKSLRYTIGVMINDLRQVTQIVAWFEKEEQLYVIPAVLLCKLLDKAISENRVGYSTGKLQWRVNFHLDVDAISSQRSGGRRVSIVDFRKTIPGGARVVTSLV